MFNRFKEFLTIFLATLTLFILSIIPAFTQIISDQSWLIGTTIFRIILVFLILIIPLVILIRFLVLKYRNCGLQRKYILLCLTPLMFLLSSIGITTYGILIGYKSIKLERAYNSAWIKSLLSTGTDNFEVRCSEFEQIIDSRKKFYEKVNNKLLVLASPIVRFCYSGLFRINKESLPEKNKTSLENANFKILSRGHENKEKKESNEKRPTKSGIRITRLK